MSYLGQISTNTDPNVIHDVHEWIPINNGRFCMCYNRESLHINWLQPGYWNEYKFWIVKGFLKGKEMPFVTHWKYLTNEEFMDLRDSE